MIFTRKRHLQPQTRIMATASLLTSSANARLLLSLSSLSPSNLHTASSSRTPMSFSSSLSFANPLHLHLSSLPNISSPPSLFFLSSLKPSKITPLSIKTTVFNTSTPLAIPNSPINAASSSRAAASQSFRAKQPKDITILVTGATGYIGKFVVRELCRRGFNVIAVVRERSGIRGSDGKEQVAQQLAGSTLCFSDVTDLDVLNRSFDPAAAGIDVVVCCLASRSGSVKDSWKIDYGASKNSLLAGRRLGAAHFVLLSAICVQKPLLEFQRAKLKFEAELEAEASKDPTFTYSIVRPTAFFKSLGGQVETVKDGKPYVMFGDGKLCACKPISEEDLASFIADCVMDEDKACKILPVGGPGKALTPMEQGEMLFSLLGREPKFLKVPIGVMDFAIGVFDFLAKVFPSLEDAAEFGKIGRYYAAESMLVMDPDTSEYSAEKTPSYGKDTLEEFFAKVIREGMAGQELGEQTIF